MLHYCFAKHFSENGTHLKYLYVLDDVSYTPYLLKKLKQAVDLVPPELMEKSAIVADTFFTRVLQAIVVPKIMQHIMQFTQFLTLLERLFLKLIKIYCSKLGFLPMA